MAAEVKRIIPLVFKEEFSVQTTWRFGFIVAFGSRLNAQLLMAVKANLTLTIALSLAIIVQS